MALPKYDDKFVSSGGDAKNVEKLLKKSNGATLNEVKWQVTLREKYFGGRISLKDRAQSAATAGFNYSSG